MAETMKEWALKYADMGLAVLPVKPPGLGGPKPGKVPYIKEWQKRASTDKTQIEKWWNQWPDANIGIATGNISGGLVVIDLDVDEDKGINGYEMLKEWQHENGELPETCQSITGRGGYHLFYKDTAANSGHVGLYPGVDIRGEGNFIVAPPSLHENGRRYEWDVSSHIEDIPIAQVNNTVIHFLMGPAPEHWEHQSFQEPEVIPEGERTSTLVRLIGSLKAKGLDVETIRAAVQAENDKKCYPPLTDQELEKTVFPALKRGWKAEAPYTAVYDKGKFRQQKNHSLEMVAMDSAEEKSPDWLIADYIPRYQITSLAGDGGSGKTTV